MYVQDRLCGCLKCMQFRLCASCGRGGTCNCSLPDCSLVVVRIAPGGGPDASEPVRVVWPGSSLRLFGGMANRAIA